MPIPRRAKPGVRREHHAVRVLGLRPNLAQFALLAAITVGVGMVVGTERVVVPLLGARVFAVTSYAATLAFIVSFGFVKAALNLIAGRLADHFGRKPILLAGWLFALPVPLILILAPSWSWVIAANVLLGVNQGFTWTMTVTSKIDLVGGSNRGFALGINEFSGYAGVSLGGVIAGALAQSAGLRVAPFIFALGVCLVSLAASFLLIRETLPFTRLERPNTQAAPVTSATHGASEPDSVAHRAPPPLPTIFALTTWGDRALAAASQAGLVEKFADALVWGLFPLYFARHSVDLAQIGVLVAVYTGSWAILQIYTGHLSDRVGRKWPIAGGMWLVAVGILVVPTGADLMWWVVGALMMGAGMALLYPTLLAVVSDVAFPRWRATSLGVYRLWRDSGYAFGALAIGLVADKMGLTAGFWFVAAMMALSGTIVALVMYETLPHRRTVHAAWEQHGHYT